MQLLEYLKANGVKLMHKGWGKDPHPYEVGLGSYDFVEGLDGVIGRQVWICDFRNGKNIFEKPIRAIGPTLVEVCDAEKAKKTIYYSPVYFRAVGKNGTLKAAEINPVDNTGFRSTPGVSANIFTDEQECCACYKKQLEQAVEERKAVLKWYQAGIDALKAELDKR